MLNCANLALSSAWVPAFAGMTVLREVAQSKAGDYLTTALAYFTAASIAVSVALPMRPSISLRTGSMAAFHWAFSAGVSV